MKKTVWTYGLISGVIVTSFMVIATIMMSGDPDFEGSMVLGWTGMLLAFSFIFLGIKKFRNKYNEGYINFGKAFLVGFYISLIASTMYVLTWAIEYTFFMPDFMEKYSALMIKQANESGKTPQQIEEAIRGINSMKENYKNTFYFIYITYIEVLPIGMLIALISALILKKKANT